MINSCTWDDEWFLSLDMPTKLVWLWAGTTDYALPGLIRGSMLSFADQLRLSLEQAEASFEVLIAAGRFEFDAAHRLLRVVDDIVGCRNQNVLRGWYNRWRNRLPESEIKYHHISTVRQSVAGRKWFRAVWKETFGQHESTAISASSKSPQLRLIETDRDNVSQGKQSRNSFQTVSDPENNDSACLTSFETVSKLYQDQDQDQIQDQSQAPLNVDTEGLSVPERLWSLQERYRAELKLTPLRPGRDDYERVREALAETGFTEEHAETALRGYYDQCRHDITKAVYFNGRTNWDPDNIRVAASMVRPAASAPADRDLGAEALEAAKEPPIPREAREAFASEWLRKKPEGE